MAAGLGFEPRQTDPESAVLPLHHPAFILAAARPNQKTIQDIPLSAKVKRFPILITVVIL